MRAKESLEERNKGLKKNRFLVFVRNLSIDKTKILLYITLYIAKEYLESFRFLQEKKKK